MLTTGASKGMGVIARAFRCLGYLKHDDKGQADGQESPVSRGIMSIIIPESPVPAKETRFGSFLGLS